MVKKRIEYGHRPYSAALMLRKRQGAKRRLLLLPVCEASMSDVTTNKLLESKILIKEQLIRLVADSNAINAVTWH